MRKPLRPDILLYNVRTPRIRSISDTAPENGLSVIREYLAAHGLTAEIVDPGGLDGYEALSPTAVTHALTPLTKCIIAAMRAGRRPGLVSGAGALALQKILDRVQRKRMRRRLADLARRAAREEIDAVGLKVWYGSSFDWAEEVTRMIHAAAPECVVIHGGPSPSVYREHYARESAADLIICSEGEYSLADVLSVLKEARAAGHAKSVALDAIAARKIPNVIMKHDGRVVSSARGKWNVTEKAMQRQEVLPDDRLHIGIVNDALGCPYSACRFCDYRTIYPEFQCKPAAKVIEEIDYFLERGVGLFRFTSGSSSSRTSLDIARAIVDGKRTLEYACFLRCEANAKDRRSELADAFGLLLESGLRAVFIGAESGNDAVLKRAMNKEATRDDIAETVASLREASKATGRPLDISMSLIYPHPPVDGVSLETSMADSLALVKEAMPDSVLPTPPAPFPGADWFEDAGFGYRYLPRDGEGPLSREEEKHRIAAEMLRLEYLLYLPPSLWRHPRLTLDGRDTRALFALNAELRAGIRSLGVELDVSDEYFLVLRAAGFKGQAGIAAFKDATMAAIISCDYRALREVTARVNARSRALAEGNR